MTVDRLHRYRGHPAKQNAPHKRHYIVRETLHLPSDRGTRTLFPSGSHIEIVLLHYQSGTCFTRSYNKGFYPSEWCSGSYPLYACVLESSIWAVTAYISASAPAGLEKVDTGNFACLAAASVPLRGVALGRLSLTIQWVCNESCTRRIM